MTSNELIYLEIRDTIAKYNNPIWLVDEMISIDEDQDLFMVKEVEKGGWITIWNTNTIEIYKHAGHCNYVYMEVSSRSHKFHAKCLFVSCNQGNKKPLLLGRMEFFCLLLINFVRKQLYRKTSNRQVPFLKTKVREIKVKSSKF